MKPRNLILATAVAALAGFAEPAYPQQEHDYTLPQTGAGPIDVNIVDDPMGNAQAVSITLKAGKKTVSLPCKTVPLSFTCPGGAPKHTIDVTVCSAPIVNLDLERGEGKKARISGTAWMVIVPDKGLQGGCKVDDSNRIGADFTAVNARPPGFVTDGSDVKDGAMPQLDGGVIEYGEKIGQGTPNPRRVWVDLPLISKVPPANNPKDPKEPRTGDQVSFEWDLEFYVWLVCPCPGGSARTAIQADLTQVVQYTITADGSADPGDDVVLVENPLDPDNEPRIIDVEDADGRFSSAARNSKGKGLNERLNSYNKTIKKVVKASGYGD